MGGSPVGVGSGAAAIAGPGIGAATGTSAAGTAGLAAVTGTGATAAAGAASGVSGVSATAFAVPGLAAGTGISSGAGATAAAGTGAAAGTAAAAGTGLAAATGTGATAAAGAVAATGLSTKVVATIAALTVVGGGGTYVTKQVIDDVAKNPVVVTAPAQRPATSSPPKPQKPAIPAKYLITEEGVGDLSLNTTVGDLDRRGLTGPRSVCGYEPEKMHSDEFDRVYPGIWPVAHYDSPNNQLFVISITGTDYQFENGIRVGSKMSDLKAIYGHRLGTYDPSDYGGPDIPGIQTPDGNFVLFESYEDKIQSIIFSRPDRGGNPQILLIC